MSEYMNFWIDAIGQDPPQLPSPRLIKLLKSGKKFLVVSETEPYYLEVYELIRKHEMAKGTWTEQDRLEFGAAQISGCDF